MTMSMNFNEFVGFKLSSNVRASLKNIEYHHFHMHKNIMEIICVLDGSVEISDGALDRNLSPGDVYIFNAHDSHRISSHESNIILTIHIQQDYYSQFFPDISEYYFLCDSYKHKEKNSNDLYHLRFLMSKLYFEYAKEIVSDRKLEELTCDLLKLMFNKFQYYVFRKISYGTYEVQQRQVRVNDNNCVNRVYTIINYIFNHFSNKLRLEDIAAKEYLSVPYLSKCIKEVSGLTFGELLSLARCEETERLLVNTSKSVDEIASQVGFASRSHLAINFKKWFRKTPSEYRQKIIFDLNNPTKVLQNSFDNNFAEIIMNNYLDDNYLYSYKGAET